jgi:predicted dehydrogenase
VRAGKLGVAIVGAGLIGKRRAAEAAAHPGSEVLVVSDPVVALRESVAAAHAARPVAAWSAAVSDAAVDVVVIATPNGYLAEIATAALGAGKHVLLEKPMGRNLGEAQRIAAAAQAAGKRVKIGFNHRYHPALARARALFAAGTIGPAINLRVRYGHGGRPGYENEWRGNPELAGGGELTDQGVHVVDLMNWFIGRPTSAYAVLQTAVWPLAPLEDNAFGVFTFAPNVVASFHTSWTQWKNLFSFELFGTLGSLVVEGLGRSYGVEQLTHARRNPLGGAPELTTESFDGPDDSWRLEWADFMGALTTGADYLGTSADGVTAMAMIDALYRSAQAGAVVEMSGSLLR